MVTSRIFKNNPFADLLDEQPRLAFESHLNDIFGGNRRRRRSARNLFPEVQAQFMGRLGSQIRKGGAPTLRFNDFLEGADIEGRYGSMSPMERGENTQRYFAPRLRHIYGF